MVLGREFPRVLTDGLRRVERALFPRQGKRLAILGWLGLGVSLAALWASFFDLKTNLALHRPVKASGACKHRPEHAWIAPRPWRLVDGKTWSYYDTCTDSRPGPWLSIDLQAMRSIERVVVTGRRDCCWGAADLPLVLELSGDGLSFVEAARRTLPFSDREPWSLELPRSEARHIRLRVDAPEPAEIVLSEVEVFGEAIP